MNNEFLGRIVKISQITENTCEIVFSHDGSFKYLPGQYVWVVVPVLKFPDSRGERRAFSIVTSLQNSNEFSIIFRTSESGYKKTITSMNPGETVKIIGPYGSAYVTDDTVEKSIVLIAGGVAIAPFLSIVRAYDSNKSKTQYRLIFVHSSEKGCFVDELAELTSKKNIPFSNIVGSFSPDKFPSDIHFQHSEFYICGPSGFVDSVYKILITKNVKIDQMHFEQHYPVQEGNLTEEDFKEKIGERNILLQAVQDSKNHVIITDSNGFIIFANKTAQLITGFTFDEMRGNTPRLWGGLMNPLFYKTFWQKKKLITGFDGTLMNRRKNGQLYYSISHISPITDHKNSIIGFIGTEEDISNRVRLENDITEQKNKISYEKKKAETMLESIGEGIIAHDKNEKVVLVNKAASEMLGYTFEELVNNNFTDIVKAVDESDREIDKNNRAIHLAFITGKKLVNELTYIRRDDSKFIAQVTNAPIMDGETVTGVIEIFRDITHEKQIDKMKTEFISLASHQLRTPLSAINWYLEMLLAGDAGTVNEEQKKFLEEAYNGSHRMTSLVNSLLNVARIESGTFMVEPVPTNLLQVTRSVLDELKVKIDERNMKITLDSDELPLIPLDPELIRIVLQNLLSNAIKYTPVNGQIKVSLKKIPVGTTLNSTIRPEKDSFLISVADNGIGIPQNQRDHIFLKLFRADNVIKSDTEGTGLGLYIIKNIIDQSQGTVWFESVENHGTTFNVLLPLSGMSRKEGTKKLN